eukprot:SAG11_NODE_12039_length_725_cov_0.731629_2_plen_71_part_01
MGGAAVFGPSSVRLRTAQSFSIDDAKLGIQGAAPAWRRVGKDPVITVRSRVPRRRNTYGPVGAARAYGSRR